MDDGWYRFLGYAVVAAIAPLLWLLMRAILLFVLRRFTPDPDWWANAPLSQVIRRLSTRKRPVRPIAHRRD
jgi:hypothetical protein